MYFENVLRAIGFNPLSPASEMQGRALNVYEVLERLNLLFFQRAMCYKEKRVL